MILEGYLKSVYLLLAIALVSILIFKFEFSFGEERPIPDWVKTTISLWSNGSITNDEFVRAIEYLSDRGIITISSVDEKESQKQIEYLKAKSEVFENEVKQLREENKEYRIQIQSQKIIKSNDYPSTMSNLLDEYQTLQNEIKEKCCCSDRVFSSCIRGYVFFCHFRRNVFGRIPIGNNRDRFTN